MTKKIFTALMLCSIILFSGCSDDSADYNENVPDVAQNSSVVKIIPNFKSKTIDGATVTKEIFAAKKITVVNIWGTFCPPCIGEMPELGEMARSMPADAQIIGLICDASDGSEQVQEAREILRKANADFVNIIPDEQLLRFLENFDAVPTTIFVNGKGEVVGKTIVGADVDGYKNELKKLLKQ